MVLRHNYNRASRDSWTNCSGGQAVGRDGCERPLSELEACPVSKLDLRVRFCPGSTRVYAAGERFAAGDEALDHRCIDEDANRVVGLELRRQRET